jgi:hypothetical protein
MKRRGRVRRVTRWVCVTLSLLSGAAWLASAHYEIVCRWDTRPRQYCLLLENGMFYMWGNTQQMNRTGYIHFGRMRNGRFIPPRLLPHVGLDTRGFGIHLPLWIPFALTTAPAFWLFRRPDRRPARLGCCAACGYNLAGLADGAACPECGKAA